MRTTIACFVVLLLASPAWADPSSRAQTVVDALRVDAKTSAKLLAILDAHETEVARLEHERAEIKRQLVTADRLDPKSIDDLLRARVANQHAFADVDGRLLTRVRKVVPGPTAVHLLFLLSVTESTSTALVPSTVCNPWTSMHRCN